MNESLLLLTVSAILLYLAYSLIRLGMERKDRAYPDEEARLMQELYAGLTRLEERTETLETTLMEGGSGSTGKKRPHLRLYVND